MKNPASEFVAHLDIGVVYMTVPEAQIKDIKPVQTVVIGKVVYAAAD